MIALEGMHGRMRGSRVELGASEIRLDTPPRHVVAERISPSYLPADLDGLCGEPCVRGARVIAWSIPMWLLEINASLLETEPRFRVCARCLAVVGSGRARAEAMA